MYYYISVVLTTFVNFIRLLADLLELTTVNCYKKIIVQKLQTKKNLEKSRWARSKKFFRGLHL